MGERGMLVVIGRLSDISHAYRERRRPGGWKQSLVSYVVMFAAMWGSVQVIGRAELWVFLAIATVVAGFVHVWDRRRTRRAEQRERNQGV